jgi:hypothetical protein
LTIITNRPARERGHRARRAADRSPESTPRLTVCLRATLLLGGVLLAPAAALLGQVARKSQHGSVMQVIGATTVTVLYNRPSARGRRLFGDLVPYGRAWTPGADTATTVAFTRAVRVAGEPLAAGTYSLWMIPEKDEAWTVIFSKAAPVFHIPYPPGHDALRVKLKPQAGSFVETLAFYFPLVAPDSAVLEFHWGETAVSIPIAVTP